MLAARLDAHVFVPLLPGHGKSEKDLLSTSFDELVDSALSHVEHTASFGKQFVLIGNSFGGLLAILATAKHMPAALVLSVTPYKTRFPFSIPGMGYALHLRRFWNKTPHMSQRELRARKHLPFYSHAPGISLSLINEGRHRARDIVPHITCPILSINAEYDPIVHPTSGITLLAHSGNNPLNTHVMLPHHPHRVFFGSGHEEAEQLVFEFLEHILQ